MSTKSHSSGGGKGKATAKNSRSSQRLKKNNNNNADVVEDKKELINKTQELISQISHSCLSDPDPEKVEEEEEEEGGGRVQGRRRRRRRSSACSLRNGIGEVAVVAATAASDQIENPSWGKTTCRNMKLMVKTSLKEVSNCLTTSKELVRVLNHVCSMAAHDQDQPSSTLSVITALKSELDRAKSRVDHLIKDHDHDHDDGDEIEVLMKQFAEEKAASKYRERARVRSAITSMADEVEVEKKLRRQAERLNKTISKELAHAKLSLSKALRDVQREKRAKEIFEEICDELAKGIGEDRAEFEELKKESAKVREEVEKEREMLHLADVLREERVQMKLSEAKFHYEEKNAAVEKLKDELETYLISGGQMGNNEHGLLVEDSYNSCNKFDKIKELEAYLKKINFGSCEEITKEEEECSEEEEEEEEESDLQSIELNMDNNNKSYRWSFVQNRNSFEKESCNNGGRKSSASDKIQWGSICLNRKPISSKNSDRFTELFTKSKEAETDNENITAEKIMISNNNKSAKCLRDILFPVVVPSQTQTTTTTEDQNQVGKTEEVEDSSVLLCR